MMNVACKFGRHDPITRISLYTPPGQLLEMLDLLDLPDLVTAVSACRRCHKFFGADTRPLDSLWMESAMARSEP